MYIAREREREGEREKDRQGGRGKRIGNTLELYVRRERHRQIGR